MLFSSFPKADLPTLTVPYRTNEAIFLKTEQERCIVIFNMSFVDPDDQLLGKVFIEEFVYARKSLPASPSCSFSLVGELLRCFAHAIHSPHVSSFSAQKSLRVSWRVSPV